MSHEILSRRAAPLFGAAALCFSGSVQADTAAVDIRDGAPTGFASPNTTHGWVFTVREDAFLTALGMYDDGSGVRPPHPMAIWRTNSQTLLGGATVDRQSPIENQFLWEDLVSPIALEAGVEYTVGVFFPNPLEGEIVFEDGFHQFDPLVQYEGFRRVAAGDELTFPDVPSVNRRHSFGANFRFSLVPSPGTSVVMLVGLAAISRRRATFG